MKIFKKAKRGFTLVELVVVIAVIAILAAVSVGAYFGVTESANNSRLEQETKQFHTALKTVALKGNSNHTLSVDGLQISNLVTFEDALKESMGTEVSVFAGEVGNFNKIAINLITDEYTGIESAHNPSNVYKTFEYFNAEVSGKKVVSNVITGDYHIVKTSISGDTTADYKTYYYIDREWWQGGETRAYTCNDDGTKTNADWPGEPASLVETVTYEDETLNVYSFRVDVSKYTKLAWTKVIDGSHVSQTTDIILSELGENNIAICNTDVTCSSFTPTFGIYEPGKANYGQFPEANTVSYYFIDQNWWHKESQITKVYFFNVEKGISPDWKTENFHNVELVETITNNTYEFNVYKIDLDLNKWDAFLLMTGNETTSDISQTEDILVKDFEEGQNLVVLLDQEEVIKNPTDSKCLTHKDTYVEGKWDYGQIVVIEKNIYTLNIKVNENWTADGARFAAYFFGNEGSRVEWSDFTIVDGETEFYNTTLETTNDYTKIIFCRMNPSETANTWDNKWNQTGDLTIPTDGKDTYILPLTYDSTDDNWMTFDEAKAQQPEIDNPTIVGTTVYFINTESWDTVYYYTFDDNGGQNNVWPGLPAKKCEGSTDVWSAVVPEGHTTVIFNNNKGSQTSNLPMADALEGKTYYHLGHGMWFTTEEEAKNYVSPWTSQEGYIYLKPNSNWTQSNAWFAFYLCNGNKGAQWIKMNAVEGNAGYYEAKLPDDFSVANYKNIIFARMDPGKITLDWSSKWNQTGDLDCNQILTNNCCAINSGQWDCGTNVTWSNI